MNTRDYIHPKLLTPGLITYSDVNEPIVLHITNELVERSVQWYLAVQKERAERELKDKAV